MVFLRERSYTPDFLLGLYLHGVVDGHACRHGSTGRVDVKGDVLLGIVVGEVQQLRHEHVGHLVIHLPMSRTKKTDQETPS